MATRVVIRATLTRPTTGELCKSRPLIALLECVKDRGLTTSARFTCGSRTWQFRQGAVCGYLTTSDNVVLPLHIVCKDWQDAQRQAEDAEIALGAGKAPSRGVFKLSGALPTSTQPLAKSDDGREAISNKIRLLINEGKPHAQAIAIALDMARRGELGEGATTAAHAHKDGDTYESRHREAA